LRVDPAPNGPVLPGCAKDGAVGGGFALIVTGVDRIRCSVTQIFRFRYISMMRCWNCTRQHKVEQ